MTIMTNVCIEANITIGIRPEACDLEPRESERMGEIRYSVLRGAKKCCCLNTNQNRDLVGTIPYLISII